RLGLTMDKRGEDQRAESSYDLAQLRYQQALDVRTGVPSADPEEEAFCFNNLALIHHQKGLYYEGRGESVRAENEYNQAEPCYKPALDLRETSLGSDHRTVALVLNNLATLYVDQIRPTEAQPLYERALEIWNNSSVPVDPNVALGLNNLADIYHIQSRYT